MTRLHATAAQIPTPYDLRRLFFRWKDNNCLSAQDAEHDTTRQQSIYLFEMLYSRALRTLRLQAPELRCVIGPPVAASKMQKRQAFDQSGAYRFANSEMLTMMQKDEEKSDWWNGGRSKRRGCEVLAGVQARRGELWRMRGREEHAHACSFSHHSLRLAHS